MNSVESLRRFHSAQWLRFSGAQRARMRFQPFRALTASLRMSRYSFWSTEESGTDCLACSSSTARRLAVVLPKVRIRE